MKGTSFLGCAGWFGLAAAAVIALAAYQVLSPSGSIRKRLLGSGAGYMRSQLGSMRSALSIYYGDLEGQYPADLDSLTVNQKYRSAIPELWSGGETVYDVPHARSNGVVYYDEKKAGDTGKWGYWISRSTSGMDAAIWIDCTHADPNGVSWNQY